MEQILSYLVVSLKNLSAASTFANEVEKHYANLKVLSFMYPECVDAHFRTRHYRKAVIRNYIMVYRVDEHTQTVYILRFFYGGQDYEKLL